MDILVMTDIGRHVDGSLNDLMQTMETARFSTPSYLSDSGIALAENLPSSGGVGGTHTTRGSEVIDSMTTAVSTTSSLHGNITLSPLFNSIPHPLRTPTPQGSSTSFNGPPKEPFPHQHSVYPSSIYSKPSSHHDQVTNGRYLLSKRPYTIPRFSRLQSREPSIAGYGSLGDVSGARPPFSPPLLPPDQKMFGSSASSFSNSNNGSDAEPRETQTGRKKRKACGHCIPCQRKENCGTCMNCINRTKGKQICIHRKCDILKKKAVAPQPTLLPTTPGQDKRKDYEGHPPRAAKRSKSNEQPVVRLSQGVLHPASHPNFSKFGDLSRIPACPTSTGEMTQSFHKFPGNFSYFSDPSRETRLYNPVSLKATGQTPDAATPSSDQTIFLEPPLQAAESNEDSNAEMGKPNDCQPLFDEASNSHKQRSRAEWAFSWGSDSVASIKLSQKIPPISLSPRRNVVQPSEVKPMQSLRGPPKLNALFHEATHSLGAKNSSFVRRNSLHSFASNLYPTSSFQENLTKPQPYNSQLFPNNIRAGSQDSLLQSNVVPYPHLQAQQMATGYKRQGSYDHSVIGQPTFHNQFQLTSSCIASTCPIQSFTTTSHPEQRSSVTDAVQDNDPNVFLNVSSVGSNDGLSFNEAGSSHHPQDSAFDQHRHPVNETHNCSHSHGELRYNSSSGIALHNATEQCDPKHDRMFENDNMESGSTSCGTASPGSDGENVCDSAILPTGSTYEAQHLIIPMSSVVSPINACVSAPWQLELHSSGFDNKTAPKNPSPLLPTVNDNSFSDLYSFPPLAYSDHASPCNPYYDLEDFNSGTKLNNGAAGRIESLVPAAMLRQKSPILLKPILPNSFLMKPDSDMLSKDDLEGSSILNTADPSKCGATVSASIVGLSETDTLHYPDSSELHNGESACETFSETMNSVLYEHALSCQSPLLRHSDGNVAFSTEHIANSHSPADVHSTISPGESGYDSMDLASTQSDSVPQHNGKATCPLIDPEFPDIPNVMFPDDDEHPVMDFSDFTLD